MALLLQPQGCLETAEMGSKLFIGNLAYRTDDESLRQVFEGFGPVREAKVIFDRETGRSRGFGFVTFENDADAKTALTGMDGCDLDGRAIRVSEAEDKGGSRAGGGGRPNHPDPQVHTRGGGSESDGGAGGNRRPGRPVSDLRSKGHVPREKR